jgi:hypothetical protein
MEGKPKKNRSFSNGFRQQEAEQRRILFTWDGFMASRSNNFFFFFSLLGWGETESTWYDGHCLAYPTSPGR